MDTNARISLSTDVETLLDLLEGTGASAWVVGGYVRDALAGDDAHDVDVATSARWQDVARVCVDAGMRVYETGTAHGTVSVNTGRCIVEVTTYRIDGPYEDARHPASVSFVDSIELDLARRDFTFNALAYHPERGLLDPYDGCSDLKGGIIRTVGDPMKRFQEDPLRILRAVRFASRFGFAVDDRTESAMRRLAPLIGGVAAERIENEFSRMLLGDHACNAIIEWIDVIGVFIPEALPMKGFDQRTPYHIYDVLEHSAHAVGAAPARRITRYAAFFHDIGKPSVFTVDDEGIGHAKGHPQAGEAIARKALQRLRLKATDIDAICTLVALHQDIVPATPRGVRRMLNRMGGDVTLFRELLDVKRADAAAHAPDHRDRGAQADEVESVLEDVLKDRSAFRIADLQIDGNDVMACGIPCGPGVGAALRAALDEVMDDRIPNERDALLSFLDSRASAWRR